MKKLITLILLFVASAVCRADMVQATVGDSVTFTASCDGTKPIAVVWKKNDAVIPGPTPLTGAIVGAAPIVLNIAAVKETDSGVYEVIFTNSAGSATAVFGLQVSAVPPPAVAPNKPSLSASVTKKTP